MPAVTVTVPGGTITINSLTFTSLHEALPSLDPGTECLLLLKRVGDTYRVAVHVSNDTAPTPYCRYRAAIVRLSWRTRTDASKLRYCVALRWLLGQDTANATYRHVSLDESPAADTRSSTSDFPVLGERL